MKLAMAQMRVQAGQIETNLATMHSMIQQATQAGADLIVFPELCVSGYVVSDRFLQKGFQSALAKANQQIVQWSSGIAIIWGNVHQLEGAKVNRDGRSNRFNAAFIAQHGQLLHQNHGVGSGVYVKHCLPDYRIFDDSRYFKSGVDYSLETTGTMDSLLKPFTLEIHGQSYQLGLQICEDLWSQAYSIQPTDAYVKAGVDFILNISSSPYTLGKEKSREKRILEHAQTHMDRMVPLLYVNAVGMQNNGKNVILFDGDSTFYSSQGKAQVRANDGFKSELLVFKTNEAMVSNRSQNKLYDALIHGLRYFDEEIFKAKPKWIIGLSGGLDSSINASLLVHALGPERVLAYNMSSRYNQPTSIAIAKQLAQDLAIKHHEGSIEGLVESTQTTLHQFGYAEAQGLALENLQARLRGHLLGSFAALEGGVIVNNGNKVEAALGYATLYGDTIGAISPLGDLTKIQLFELAQTINQIAAKPLINPKLIPQLVEGRYQFEFAPSAELKDDQVDPMKWGYHDALVSYLIEYPTHHPVEFLALYASGAWRDSVFAPWIKAYGLDEPKAFVEDYRWFVRNWHQAVFKRIQFPPILLLSRGSFGYDYRESQLMHQSLADEDALIQQILKTAGGNA